MAVRGLNICTRRMLLEASRACVIRGALQSDCWKCRVGAKRYLLSEDVVKLQEFQRKKFVIGHQVSVSKVHYFETVNQKIQRNELILKDELKLLLHLCQSAEDVVIARNAIYRYHKENRSVAFDDFKFGPLLMRLCYELGLEDMAAAMVTDQMLKGFFTDSTSFNIAIDMLFTKGSFDRALEVAAEMSRQRVSFNKFTFTLAFATCYKLNSPKSYRICLALMEDALTKSWLIPRQAYCFAVALALRQNDVERAQTIYSKIMNTDSMLCQNVKVLMLANSGCIKEAVSVLSSALVSSSPSFVKKLQFSKDVVEVLREQSGDGSFEAEVERVVMQLHQASQVTNRSLDDLLCQTPSGRRRPLGIFEEKITSRRTKGPKISTLLLE